jgi:hypothetical protein
MKKSILTFGAVLASAACVMAQGTLNYNQRISGVFVTHTYLGGPGEGRYGNTATDLPAGTQTYTGALLQGTNYSAQLFYAVGAGQPLSALVAAPGSLTTFRTGGTFGGTIAGTFLPLPGTTVGGAATLQLRAWDNAGGTIQSWDNALIRGQSEVFTVLGLADPSSPNPPNMQGSGVDPNTGGLRSFNIVPVPEPSTFLLGGIGAAALLIFRRRK